MFPNPFTINITDMVSRSAPWRVFNPWSHAHEPGYYLTQSEALQGADRLRKDKQNQVLRLSHPEASPSEVLWNAENLKENQT